MYELAKDGDWTQLVTSDLIFDKDGPVLVFDWKVFGVSPLTSVRLDPKYLVIPEGPGVVYSYQRPVGRPDKSN